MTTPVAVASKASRASNAERMNVMVAEMLDCKIVPAGTSSEVTYLALSTYTSPSAQDSWSYAAG